MEFHEKLQELRKSKNLTQEELAHDLYVSRTAISKWESGRGYPNIESLKQISQYYSVSIDRLLSGDELMHIAEKECTDNLQKTYRLIFGLVDFFSFIMILLPLYPKEIDGYIYAVSLFSYGDTAFAGVVIHWILFISLMAVGAWQVFSAKYKSGGTGTWVLDFSIGIGVFSVIFLTISRVTYGATLAFLMLVIKCILMVKLVKKGYK